jgi:hypothetical protein
MTAQDLVKGFFDAFLQSQEETLFVSLLKDWQFLYVARHTVEENQN